MSFYVLELLGLGDEVFVTNQRSDILRVISEIQGHEFRIAKLRIVSSDEIEVISLKSILNSVEGSVPTKSGEMEVRSEDRHQAHSRTVEDLIPSIVPLSEDLITEKLISEKFPDMEGACFGYNNFEEDEMGIPMSEYFS
jgi:hypothetical protein